MKAKLQGFIQSIERVNGNMHIKLNVAGKVDTSLINAKDIISEMNIKLKSSIGDQLKLGNIITVTISDDELISDDKNTTYSFTGGK